MPRMSPQPQCKDCSSSSSICSHTLDKSAISAPIAKRSNERINRITDNQVYALLRSGDNKLTIKRLASATNSTDSAAKGKLNQMVVDGLLDVTNEDLYLIYSAR